MKLFVVLALLLFCGTAFAKPPTLGEKLPADAQLFTIQGHRAPVVTDTGQTLDAYRITRDSVHYIAGIDQGRAIAYITLDADRSFKTSEGISLGSPLRAVMAATKHAPTKVSGWAYYFPLPSGWNAAFIGSPQDPTPSELPRTSKVDFLFKSRSIKR
jgi:hypothetical protein